MASRRPGSFLPRSLRALQGAAQESGPAAAASYGLIGAIVLFGGIGYALDAALGTSPGFLVGGLILGIVAGFYQLARAVWRR